MRAGCGQALEVSQIQGVEMKSRPEAAGLLYKPPESSIASTTAIPYLTIKFCRFVFEIDFVLGWI